MIVSKLKGAQEQSVVNIDPRKIEANKDNPRIIFDREDQVGLEKSIREQGILVSLTVFRRASNGKYVILDGERRWRCAISLGLKTVPCNLIPEPSREENLLQMFNIHATRKEWELVPTALKLEVLIRLMGDKSNTELARLTSMTAIRVSECKKILSFPKKYLDYALVSDPGRRITGDFFSQLHRFLEGLEKYPELKKEFSRDKVTEIMIQKYKEGSFPAILDFRVLKKTLEDAHKFNVPERHVTSVTRAYLKEQKPITSIKAQRQEEVQKDAMKPKDYYETIVGASIDIVTLNNVVNKLQKSLQQINRNTARDNRLFMNSLQKLRNTIDRIIG
jgi:ParB family chromosome partitioning protein